MCRSTDDMKPVCPKFKSGQGTSNHPNETTHRTASDECVSNNKRPDEYRPDSPAKMTTYPSKSDQGALLRKLHHKLLLIHRACITRRMLLRDQQGGNYKAPTLIFAEKQPACLSVPRRIYRCDRCKPIQAVAREGDRLKLKGDHLELARERDRLELAREGDRLEG